MIHSDFAEQVDCLQNFACSPHKDVTIDTDPDERGDLFESIINDVVKDLDGEE